MFECHYCPDSFKSSRGRATHLGKEHQEEFHADVRSLAATKLEPDAIAKRLSCSPSTVKHLLSQPAPVGKPAEKNQRAYGEATMERIFQKLNPKEQELLQSKLAGTDDLGQQVVNACIALNSRALLAEGRAKLLENELSKAESRIKYLDGLLAKRDEAALDEKARAAVAAAGEGSLLGKD